ncbi:MAG: hypothetical protein HYZ57_21470 [Acidobacteria bacterium]|nr:hypothetical protein [Acidobacteriota bacterium]MBI3282397.1 hypothetical protein [Acidobacteriota bacterium]
MNPGSVFCANCGSPLAPEARFCNVCGQAQPLAAEGAPQSRAAVEFVPRAGIRSSTGAWLSEGWTVIKGDLGAFALMGLLYLVINGLVPVIMQGPLAAGLELAVILKLVRGRVDFADMFKGFNYFVPTLVASLIISAFVFVGSLFCLIPGIVLAAMYLFTFLFIIDKRMDFWPAMQASHAVVKNDYFGFSLFVIAAGLINLLGVLACIVGLLITIPWTFAAITVAYRDLVGFESATAQQ